MLYKTTDRVNVGSGEIPDSVDVVWRSTIRANTFSSPVVVGGNVYIGSGSDNAEFVQCFDAGDGTLLWETEVSNGTHNQYGLSCTPAVYGGRVYLNTADYHAICLDAGTGAMVWDEKLIMGDLPNIAWGGSSPLVSGGKVYTGTDIGISDHPNLWCLDADGNGNGTTDVIWNYTLPNGGAVYSSPSISDDRLVIGVYAGATSGEVLCLDAVGNGDGTTSLIWSFTMPAPTFATAVIDDGIVYIGHGDYQRKTLALYNVYAIDLDSSGDLGPLSEEWHHSIPDQILAAAVPFRGYVYAADLGGTVHCIETDPGFDKGVNSVWTFDTGADIWATPTIVGDRMVFSKLAGDMYCLDLNGTEVWRLDITDGEIYSTAPFVDGRLYVGTTAGELVCIGEKTTNPPKVVSTSPSDGEDGVDISSSITVNFDQNMVESTLSDAWSLEPDVPGGLATTSRSITFTPTGGFDHATVYTVTIAGTAMSTSNDTLDGDGDGDGQGSPVDDYTFTFTTEDEPVIPPDNHAPELSQGDVDPESGTESTEYVFSVIYTDEDDDEPDDIFVIIDGDTKDMFRSSDAASYLTDRDYTNGEKYEYVTTLTPGEYDFSFEASDGGETVTRAGGGVKVEADDVPDGDDGTDGEDGNDGGDDGDDGEDGGDGDDGDDEYKPDKDDDESTPGFGSLAVLGALAVVGAGMIIARRRRDE
jgi:outer membrane protein assembly factor BamB